MYVFIRLRNLGELNKYSNITIEKHLKTTSYRAICVCVVRWRLCVMEKWL